MSAHKASADHDYKTGELVKNKLYQDVAGTAVYEFQKYGRRKFLFSKRTIDDPQNRKCIALDLAQLVDLIPISEEDIVPVGRRRRITLHQGAQWVASP